MFILNQSETYKWPVSIPCPIDGGKFLEQELYFDFLRQTTTQMQEMMDSELSDDEIVKKIIKGWYDVQNDSEPLQFSLASFEILLDKFPSSRKRIIGAYLDSQNGILRKNS